MSRHTAVLLSLLFLAPPCAARAAAQSDGTCVPAAERGARTLGCYITARTELGRLPRDTALFWYIDSLPPRSAGATTTTPRSTLVRSLGHTWIFTIAPAGWRPRVGIRVARIGPLPPFTADSFAAVYMEGVFAPGMQSVVHRHPGTEAWYTLVGEQCLETPHGRMVQRAGGPGVWVAGGEPMQLTGTGTGVRQSLVLVLQDATQPRSTPAHDWTPKGLCQQT